MKKILILALILFASCEETFACPQLLGMTYSDALPVQFWPDSCDTYNEKESCGIHSFCFCQPFECDDEITVQLSSSTYEEYYLQVLDENDNELYNVQLDQTDNSIPGTSEIPGETNPVTLPGLDEGYNVDGADTDWTEGSNPTIALVGLSGADPKSDPWVLDLEMNENSTYKITPDIDYDMSGAAFTGTLRFVVLDDTNNIVHTQNFALSPFGLPNVFNTEIEFVAGANYSKFGFIFLLNNVLPTGTVTLDADINSITATETTPTIPAVPETPATNFINTISFVPSDQGICDQKVRLQVYEDASPDVVVLKSDCLDIRTTHKCTTLIEYTNSRNFAGLNYSDSSPEPTFYLRVPSVFFHERFPGDTEQMELSDRIITLNSSIKTQKRLETDYMPYYMHRKIKLALSHQTVTIDGLTWTKEEDYEVNDGENKRYPMRSALCWLTQKESIERNVL